MSELAMFLPRYSNTLALRSPVGAREVLSCKPKPTTAPLIHFFL